jgi:hypothetical protein
MIGKYNGKALETMEKIMDDVKSWYVNKVYFNSKHNIYWFINKNGYLHILKPESLKMNGKPLHYIIQDYLLTKDNMLKDNGNYGDFKTIENAIEYLNNEVNNDERML